MSEEAKPRRRLMGTPRSSASRRQALKMAISPDPVIQAYMRDIDRTLLRENLKLTPAQRLEKLVCFSSFAEELRQAGKTARGRQSENPPHER